MRKALILTICLVFFIPSKTYSAINPKDQAKVILYTGLYGAVLGLSTLSFYDKPSSRIRNVFMGAALGLIASVVISTVVATKKDKERTQVELRTKSTDPNLKTNDAKSTDKQNGEKDGNKNKNDEDDFFNSEEFEDDEEDDEYIYNDKNIEFKLFFASFSNNEISFNPDFVILNQNSRNDGYDIYGKVLSFRF